MKTRLKIFSSFVLCAMLLTGCSDPGASNDPEYEISFYTDGGSKVDSIKAKAGTAITEPLAPFKAEHTFEGWYEDFRTFNVKYVFDTMPEKNITLYAKWSELTDDEILEYRNYLASISKENHLYIHYLRFNSTIDDYKNWGAWVWPAKQTGRMFNWMPDSENPANPYYDKYGGVMTEIDLTTVYTDGGHDGKGGAGSETVNFFDEENNLTDNIGFLLTYIPSRSAGGHWVSDGGDKMASTSKALAVGPNGSLHIFAVQDNVSSFTYQYGGEIYTNPYENDDGSKTSAIYNDVNSSGEQAPIVPTSEALYSDGVGYQVMVSSFADSDGDGMGDIWGIVENLDYFEYLNVEVLWLTPIQLSDSYHGYDIIDYKVIDPKFGSKQSPNTIGGEVTTDSAMQDYLELIERAEEHGIKVIMDLVVNHTSINNVLFQKSISLDPDFRAYYHWRNHTNDPVFDNPKFATNWHKYSTYDYSYYGKFASSMPELNFDYQATRDVIVDITDYWCNLGVAGFRIDAVKHVYMQDEVDAVTGDVIINDTGTTVDYSSNLTKNLHFFRELNSRLKSLHPDAFIVGENYDGHAYRVASYYEGLDSMLNFYMYYNLTNSAANGNSNPTWRVPAKISGGLTEGVSTFTPNSGSGDEKVNVKYGSTWNYPGVSATFNKYRSNNGALDTKAVDGLFTSNHDLARPINRVTGNLDAAGEISTSGVVSAANSKKGTQMALCTNIATITMPGLSWIYYGDELGMSSNLPDGNANASHADRWSRQPFKWDQAGENLYTTGYTFTGDKTYSVEWDSYNETLAGVKEQKLNPNSPLRAIKEVTALKSQYATLKTGSYVPITGSTYNVFAFKRVGANNETISVYINMSNDTATCSATGDILFSLEGASKTSLPAWSVLITRS